MAYIATVDTVMAHIVIARTSMVCIVMSDTGMAIPVYSWYTYIFMAYIVMAYIVTACANRGLSVKLQLSSVPVCCSQPCMQHAVSFGRMACTHSRTHAQA